MSVVYAVSPPFVPSLNHAIKELDDVLAQSVLRQSECLTPSVWIGSVLATKKNVANKTVLVEDRDGLFELTSQSVVEGERNKCGFVLCLATIVFHMPSFRSLTQASSFGVSVGAGKGTCR